jgi:hypothetical protein
MEEYKESIREGELGGMERIILAQNKQQWDLLENTAIQIRVPCNTEKF